MSNANKKLLLLILILGLITSFQAAAHPVFAETSPGSLTVDPSSLQLRVGEQQLITVKTNMALPYTAVLGWDNPAIGTLTSQGLFTARTPGQGLITVSAGNYQQHIYVQVIE